MLFGIIAAIQRMIAKIFMMIKNNDQLLRCTRSIALNIPIVLICMDQMLNYIVYYALLLLET